MSETRSTYRRSVSGLIGAIVMTFVLIGAIWVLTRFQDHQSFNPTPPVQYADTLAEAVSQAPFAPYAPVSIPAGWRTTSATFSNTGSPVAWHLGFLTSSSGGADYVGLDQSNENATDFRTSTTRADQQGPTLEIAGQKWSTWTSSDGGEVALVHTDAQSTTIVSGTAGKAVLESFVATLRPRAPS